MRSLALRFPAGYRVESHEHPWSQLVYATEGAMTVDTGGGYWVVPPHRAVWVPAGIRHGIQTTGSVRMRTLYFRSSLTSELPSHCRVVSVSALLRELVLETLRLGMLHEDVPEQSRLAGVLVDQLRVTSEMPLEITWPIDERARRVADSTRANLAGSESLASLARNSGAGVRTLERLFLKETGMTFRRWRQQARLLHALRLLAAGESVSTTALEVGFTSASAFISMFRRTLGKTPGHYFRDA